MAGAHSPYYLGSDQHPEAALDQLGTRQVQRPVPIVCADRLDYILFQRSSLECQRDFLLDFGLQLAGATGDEMFFRGQGHTPWFYKLEKGPDQFLGAGFAVNTRQELQQIAAETGKPVEQVEGPGGGERVRLSDPDGFIVDLVYGREDAERFPARRELFEINTPESKPRINKGVRSTAMPCAIEKLGHFVLAVTDFERSSEWYMHHLGLIPTDVQCVADGTPVLAFCRLDRGSEPADHHTVVFLQNIEADLMHSAYEVLDLDEIGQGAQWLRSKGWRHHWGIGRHVLGSQIFDYWLDPSGVEMEHYADGDVFTADHPTQYHLLDRGGLWSWGDDLPPMPGPGPLKLIGMLLTGKLARLPESVHAIRQSLSLSPRPWLN